MTCCLGQCPWSPSPPACSGGRAHSVGREFALGDPPCWRGLTSPSASQSHSGFRSPLGEKNRKKHVSTGFQSEKSQKTAWLFLRLTGLMLGMTWTLTLHWTPGVEPCFHQLISHFDIFNASDHSKGEMSLPQKKNCTVKLELKFVVTTPVSFCVRQTEPVWATCGIMLGSCPARTHVHGGVDLCDSFILCGELINLHAVTDQLAHDLDLQLVQFAPVHSIRLGNDGDDVHLHRKV